MNPKIFLYWYKIDNKSINFGDELSYYIISKLSGCTIERKLIPSHGFDYLYQCIKRIYRREISLNLIPILLKQFFINKFVVGIGSILPLINNSKSKIWGSGIISKKDNVQISNIYAVRGKYTQKRLEELNLNVPNVIGDPALLLPVVYPIIPKDKFRLGIIPHYTQYNKIYGKLQNNIDMQIIDMTKPVEEVIESITSCKYTISTSLHGIIVSHAYQIPCLWYYLPNNQLAGDDVKFYDYFSSVEIKEYLPFALDLDNFNINNIIEMIESLFHQSKINNSLHKIQKDLISVAPFNVEDKYRLLL